MDNVDAKPLKPQDRQPDMSVGLEEFLEDLFGLNIRSFKSIWQLFRNPAPYFTAAKTADWNNQSFTPSMRIWLGLMAILVALQFLWASPDTAIFEAAVENMRKGLEQNPNSNIDINAIDFNSIVDRMMKLQLVFQPFVLITIFTLSATFIRFWGEKLSFVVRTRYIFAVIIPASVVNVFINVGLGFASPELLMPISIVQFAIMILLYATTAYFGPYSEHPLDQRIPKTIVLTGVLLILVILSGLITTVLGVVFAIPPEISYPTS